MLPVVIAALITAGACWFCASHHAPMIQDDILTRTREVLGSAKIATAGLTVDGRDVVLRGVRGSREVSEQAQELARNLWGVNSVRVEVTDPPPAQVQAPAVKEAQTKIDEIIRLKNIEFLSGSAQLTAGGAATLNEVAAALGKSATLTVSIAGHTDSQGVPAANQVLSQARAEAVKTYLTSKGVAASRMTTAGFGQTRPIADNATPEGRQRNRRIEFGVTGGGQAEVLPATAGAPGSR